MPDQYDVIVIGGGLAGLTASCLLSRSGCRVLLLEKKRYPFHKVCGEYISNEVLEFLKSLGVDPFSLGASQIRRLRISDPNGRNIYIPLGLGGFGISRYLLDESMAQVASKNGTKVSAGTRATSVHFDGYSFAVSTGNGQSFYAPVVIGSYGKRDALDKKLNRPFINNKTGYIGVKYHIRLDYPPDEVALDNFSNGYCGIVKIEKDLYNLCYLYKRKGRHVFSEIAELEKNVLMKNPVLHDIFKTASFEFREPLVISEISFASKKAVDHHILMCGDSAGLIAPLCGNGMSMAIHGGKVLSELILRSELILNNTPGKRKWLEREYQRRLNSHFRSRLRFGRAVQSLFGQPFTTSLALKAVHFFPRLERWLVDKSHGRPI